MSWSSLSRCCITFAVLAVMSMFKKKLSMILPICLHIITCMGHPLSCAASNKFCKINASVLKCLSLGFRANNSGRHFARTILAWMLVSSGLLTFNAKLSSYSWSSLIYNLCILLGVMGNYPTLLFWDYVENPVPIFRFLVSVPFKTESAFEKSSCSLIRKLV